MLRNVEIKARVKDLAGIIFEAKLLSGSGGEVIKQTDTFFLVPSGRLKLRNIEGKHSELIYYDRPDGDGPKLSQYEKCDVNEPSKLCSVLTRALGERGTVKKTRYLFMVGQTRVHIDQVEGLGNFMELEVMLSEDQSLEDGQNIAHALMKKLGVNKEDLIAGAYMDLLLQK
ncbi:adenylate cyclase CyaB [Anabrus simplex]|uniref:adenylate cyclase CyaB n=1 Tax=Anabrus simplex TaxID=316456 RepID=UPI0035A2998B